MTMTMSNIDRYSTAIRSFGEYGCSNREAVAKVKELYPKWSVQKQKNAAHPHQISAEIGSFVSTQRRGTFDFRYDKTVRPARIYYIGDDVANPIPPDTKEAIFKRSQVVSDAEESMSIEDNNRMDLLGSIRDMLNKAGLKVVLEHAESLLEGREAAHHPDNIQILSNGDNQRKSSKSCKRFTFKEQSAYLMNEVKTLKRIGVSVNEHMVTTVLEMLKTIW